MDVALIAVLVAVAALFLLKRMLKSVNTTGCGCGGGGSCNSAKGRELHDLNAACGCQSGKGCGCAGK